ncbi:MAG TPA: GMC family oxidoreductase N-terminal domain-containing protein [Gryllotalpicola sp.]
MTEEFDVIVVGAGSAGAVVAGRLAADPGARVLVLEAGPAWSYEQCPPELRHPTNMYKWDISTRGAVPPGYKWETQPAVRHHSRAPYPYLRGKGLGGSSAVNGCYAIRPTMEEFDRYEAQFGITNWSAADVLPYFIKLERDVDFGDRPYHSSTGPTPITRVPVEDWGSIDLGLRDGAFALGHPWEPDHNRPGALGVTQTASNIDENMVRITTNDSYLEPVRGQDNLTILGGAVVDRVLFDGTRVTGVVASIYGERRVFAAAEVVVSAGATLSPGILQRSGLGPAELLRSLDIPVIADLPVGVGLQDHSGFEILLKVPNGRPAASNRRRGNCTIRYSSGLPDGQFGDLLITDVNVVAGSDLGDLLCKLGLNYSRGSVRISSPDPSVLPAVDFNLLTDPRDIELSRYCLRHAFEIVRAGYPEGTVIFDADDREVDTDMTTAELDAWAASIVRDTAHAAGGIAIGADDDPNAALDTECNVRGVEGLRVADASVFPIIPMANTHLPAVMVGERVADWVAKDLGLRTAQLVSAAA